MERMQGIGSQVGFFLLIDFFANITAHLREYIIIGGDEFDILARGNFDGKTSFDRAERVGIIARKKYLLSEL